MVLFRTLDQKEEAEFKQWATDNFVPGMAISPVWHPVVRETLETLQEAYNKRHQETLDGMYDHPKG